MKFDYIKQFEQFGLGIFVHFGLYSQIGKGEWYKLSYGFSDEEYDELTKGFNPHKNWAKDLVTTAKKAGAKYINITTRHHDGFSLYDTLGLSKYDSTTLLGRDLIKEFVDECHKQNIKPFFYHTLIDWNNHDYDNDFDTYIDYLIKSVEILCTKYGEIGGFWFDGYWAKPDANWQFDRLYSTIRKYQPKAMIINNTGLSQLGEVSHYEIDSVTFERGKPAFVSSLDGKERAGEVCDSLTDHWGYCKNDICIKSIKYLIDTFIDCRKYKVNYLLNVAPNEKGLLRPIEKATLLEFGKWTKRFMPLLNKLVPSDLEADNATIFKDDKYYYAFINDVPMQSNESVARKENRPNVVIHTDLKIKNAIYLDNKEAAVVNKNNIQISPFNYGESMYTRVVRFKLK